MLSQFQDSFFLPLLASPSLPSSAIYTQISSKLCSLMVAQAMWPQLKQLLDSCAASLRSAAVQGPGAGPAPATPVPGSPPRLPLHTTCCLVPSVLAACGTAGPAAASATQGVLQHGLQQLLQPSLQLLSSSDPGCRQATLRAMLPSLTTCAQSLGKKVKVGPWELRQDKHGHRVQGAQRTSNAH